MKSLSQITAVLYLFSAIPVLASGTAYDALRAVGSAHGSGAQNRVLEISGKGGRPQPVSWKVRIEEEGARGKVLELEVKGKKVVGQRKVADSSSARVRLALSAVQLDSDGAFAIADAEAVRSDVSFDRLNYSLRTVGNFPVWSVELFDGPAALVGSLKISADNGSVIERSASLALSEEDKKEQRWSKPGEKPKSVEDFVHRAGSKIKRTGYQLRNFFSGEGWTDEKNP